MFSPRATPIDTTDNGMPATYAVPSPPTNNIELKYFTSIDRLLYAEQFQRTLLRRKKSANHKFTTAMHVKLESEGLQSWVYHRLDPQSRSNQSLSTHTSACQVLSLWQFPHLGKNDVETFPETKV